MLVIKRIIKGEWEETFFFRGMDKTYAIDHVFFLVHLGVREKNLADLDEED